MKKTNYIEPNSGDTNIVSEPEMAYTYENKRDSESILVGKFDEITYPPQKILQPDDDLRNAITMEEFLVGVHESIDRFFTSIGK
jgi:hypothetical protein